MVPEIGMYWNKYLLIKRISTNKDQIVCLLILRNLNNKEPAIYAVCRILGQ
jgi:hypothetical protein